MKKVISLYCSDGHFATAKAEQSQKKWTIFGISEGDHDFDYKKVLFDTTFDDIKPFNSMSGVSYVAVKKNGLWGLIRFRQNPEFAYSKETYEKAIGTEPIDIKAMDPHGREIKLIEDIKSIDTNTFIEKYHLDKFDTSFHYTEERELREWSDSLIEYTKDTLSNLEFGCTPEGTVRMKRNDGSYGFILLSDALSNKYNIHYDDNDIIEHYNNVSEVIENGWVLD